MKCFANLSVANVRKLHEITAKILRECRPSDRNAYKDEMDGDTIVTGPFYLLLDTDATKAIVIIHDDDEHHPLGEITPVNADVDPEYQ